MKHLAGEGMSVRALARQLGRDRKTVRKYLSGGEPGYRRQAPYRSKLDCHREYVRERLRACPQLTAEKLFRELKAREYSGSYRQVARLVRELRPEVKQRAFQRIETPPGVYAQMDWGELGRVEHYGRRRKLYVFSLVLCHSRALYVEFTVDTTLPTLLRCHQRAFQYFGGVSRKIRYDNMTTVVKWHLQDSEAGVKEVRFNDSFLRFCNHYGFQPEACAPYAPHEKGKVENSVGYVNTSLYTGTEAADLATWNRLAREWLDGVANVRRHGTTGLIPREELAKERSELLPLPEHVYEVVRCEQRKVHRDCTLSFDGNYYSAPHPLVGRRVTVKADETHLRIYADGQLQATHPLCPYRGKFIKDPRHYEGIKRPRRSGVSKYVALFEPWGAVGERFVRALIAARPDNPYYHLNQIAAVADDFPPELVCSVLSRALEYGAFDCATVKRLLLAVVKGQRFDPESCPPITVVQCVHCPPHAGEVQQRSLLAYEVAAGCEPAAGTGTTDAPQPEVTPPCQA